MLSNPESRNPVLPYLVPEKSNIGISISVINIVTMKHEHMTYKMHSKTPSTIVILIPVCHCPYSMGTLAMSTGSAHVLDRMWVTDSRFVGGCARAGSVTPEDYRNNWCDPISAFGMHVAHHMNGDLHCHDRWKTSWLICFRRHKYYFPVLPKTVSQSHKNSKSCMMQWSTSTIQALLSLPSPCRWSEGCEEYHSWSDAGISKVEVR